MTACSNPGDAGTDDDDVKMFQVQSPGSKSPKSWPLLLTRGEHDRNWISELLSADYADSQIKERESVGLDEPAADRAASRILSPPSGLFRVELILRNASNRRTDR